LRKIDDNKILQGGVNMKIAISSTEPNPDAQVDLRFGRCRCFALVDVDADTYDYIDNETAALTGGTGLQAAAGAAEAVGGEAGAKRCGSRFLPALIRSRLSVY
jgi:hypothetical protein